MSYPGVYIEEVPSGVRTIIGVPTSITAFLGRAPRGPIDQPVTITSFADFDRQFGGLTVNCPMSYAVRDFYLNGGSTALIVRIYKGTDGEDGVATLKVGKLHLMASSPGKWGEKLRVKSTTVDDPEEKATQGLAVGDDLFNLTVTDTSPGGITETIQNLAVLKDAVRRVDRVLAAESSLVRWKGSWPSPDPTGITDGTDDATAKEEAVTGFDSAPLDQQAYEGDPGKKTAMQALVKTDLFNLLCIPPDTHGGDVPAAVYRTALQFCADHRAMLIVDSPAAWSKHRDEAASRASEGLT